MTIGDALFARLAIRGFSKLGAQIGATQARIASGVNDPRASADPARAVDLSALRDMRARLETRDGLARRAADRLALTDETLAGVSDNLRQLQTLALRAANDTLTAEAHAALRTEALGLRDALLAAANAADAAGRPLFAGTAPGPAFTTTPEGAVYRGNDATLVAQLGDRARIATSLPGSRVFGSGAGSVFALLDDTIAGLSEPMLSARPEVRVANEARLELARSRAGDTVEVTLTGPAGSARVTLDLRLDAPQAPLEAINAATAQTGIRAEMDPDGRAIRLRAEGEITLSDQTGGSRQHPALTLGAPGRATTGLRPAALSASALVGATAQAVEHMATMRAAAGSLAQAVDRATEANAARRLAVDQAVSGLEDVDIAGTVTRLQSLLLTQQAAQQTFVKITGQSLFNYLR